MAQLNGIGFEWTISEGTGLNEKGWQHKFQLLSAFQREHGHCRVPGTLEINSVKLGQWVNAQRQYYKNRTAEKTGKGARITDERIAQLNGIGFEWTICERTGLNEKGWQHKFQLLCAFQREHGHCRVPQKLAVCSVNLGTWVNTQRQFYKNRTVGKTDKGARITDERIAQLNEIGFEWTISDGPCVYDEVWQRNFQLLCEFQLEHGHCRVPQSFAICSVKLGQWVTRQRQFYRNRMAEKTDAGASITEECIAQLNEIGFEW